MLVPLPWVLLLKLLTPEVLIMAVARLQVMVTQRVPPLLLLQLRLALRLQKVLDVLLVHLSTLQIFRLWFTFLEAYRSIASMLKVLPPPLLPLLLAKLLLLHGPQEHHKHQVQTQK